MKLRSKKVIKTMKKNQTHTITKTDAEKLHAFEKKINIKFKSLELLKNALTHRSYINEWRGGKIQNNERLEFLGDAVLELLVSQLLFINYPDHSEGDLTSFRAATVKTESLAETADRLEVGEYIFMSKGEEASGGRKRKYLLANAFEAIIGAVFLDKGVFATKKFLERELFYKIPEIIDKRLDVDDKSKLQEIAQEILRQTPIYNLAKEEGPDHDKTFTMRVIIGDKELGMGKGKSKQEAEQKAAGHTLAHWKEIVENKFNTKGH